ncbi:AAA family ATPase [Patescibacteria group bacterium]|nr:MAG: AAA family ATPase [Patescibacteria group bacterium]
MDGPFLKETQGEPRVMARIGDASFAWSERVDVASIALRKARNASMTAVNLVAFFVSVCALATSILLYSFVRPTSLLSPSMFGLFASCTLLGACFVYYRLEDASRRHVAMPRQAKDATLPALEPALPQPKPMNVAALYSVDARKAVEDAYALAERYGHAEILPLHLFVGTLAAGEASLVFMRLGVGFDALKEPLGRRLQSQQLGRPPRMSAAAEEALVAAFVNAHGQDRALVSPVEVLREAYARDPFLKELLFDLKVDERRFENAVEWLRIDGKMRERYQRFRGAASHKPTGAMNRAMTSVATPALDAFSEDLTTLAVQGALPMLVGRDREMESVFRVIEGARRSVLLVGPDGTGRATLLAGIAQRMVEERVPKVLQDRRLVSLSLPHLLSGVSAEEAQERLLTVLVEVSRAKNIVLAIPDLHLVSGTPVEPLLADALSRGVAYAIATTDTREYAAMERSPLGRLFEKVDVPEPGEDDAIHILESKVGAIEYEHKVLFTYEAVEKAVKLSDRYMHEQYLPAKAIGVCREAAQAAAKAGGEGARVTGEDVEAIIAEKTGVPLGAVAKDETQTLLTMEKRLHERVIGQDEAVKSVAAALRRARTELRSDTRPIAAFLFLGPTGVGKTELAKAIAATYFGAEDAMLRFDMSEYQEQGSVERLIGNVNNPSGLLTEAVRRRPFAILLLDEFEKAHPDILNLFLQVFDDGRLTDASGRTVDFTNCIIVATSNAGTSYVQQAVAEGKPLPEIRTRLMEQELRGIYRPELLNRFDGVIVFKPLTKDEVLQIAYLLIGAVSARLEPKGIAFRATDEAVAELAQKGFDPLFGARPLRRVIQEEVDNAIAKALLEGRVRRRDTIVLKPGGQIDIEQAAAL